MREETSPWWRLLGSRSFEVDCLLEIERTAESFHAHAVPEGVELRPGDRVVVHGAPAEVPFGTVLRRPARATVHRAAWPERAWARSVALFELTELYHVGFEPEEAA